MNLKNPQKGTVQKIEPGRTKRLLKWVFELPYTGRIIFRRGRNSCSFYFNAGAIIYAKTNNTDHRLGELLKEARGLGDEEINYAVKLSQAREEQLGMVLLGEKLILPKDLYNCLVHQVELIAGDVIQWETGICYLHPGVAPGKGVVLLRVPLDRIIGEKKQERKPAEKEADKKGGDLPVSREAINNFIVKMEDMKEGDHYAVLGIRHDADPGQIKETYGSLVRMWHPDRMINRLDGDDMTRLAKIFARINEAYAVVGNAKARENYDRMEKNKVVGRKKVDKEISLVDEARKLFQGAMTLMKEGHYSQASDYLKKACQLDPDKAKYFYYLGASFYKRGKSLKQAEEALYRAIELDGSCPDYYVALGQVYKAGKLYSRAMDLFERAIKWDPHHQTAIRERKLLKDRLRKKK